jgi:hypothetical protein
MKLDATHVGLSEKCKQSLAGRVWELSSFIWLYKQH